MLHKVVLFITLWIIRILKRDSVRYRTEANTAGSDNHHVLRWRSELTPLS
jgi:hypothetical protein